MKERWKIVTNFEAYEVSNLGSVRRRLPGKSTKVGRKLKPYPDKDGYLTIRVARIGDDKQHTLKVHRLVAESFLDNPNSLPEVNHTGNNSDNRATKLEWISKADHGADIARRQQVGNGGVHFKTAIGKWSARYTHYGKRIHLGYFMSKKEALKAVIKATKENHAKSSGPLRKTNRQAA